MIRCLQFALLTMVLLYSAFTAGAAEDAKTDSVPAVELKSVEKSPATHKAEEEARERFHIQMMERNHREHTAAASRMSLAGLAVLAVAAAFFFWLIKNRWARVAIVVASAGTAFVWFSYWSSLVF